MTINGKQNTEFCLYIANDIIEKYILNLNIAFDFLFKSNDVLGIISNI